MALKIKPRLGLSESFNDYAKRNNLVCSCGRKHDFSDYTAIPLPWEHTAQCALSELYVHWRAYVERVFPGRICPRDEDEDTILS